MILPNKLAIAKDATQGVKNVKFPEDLKQLRSFLSACNVFRRFIKKYAHIATPLNRMLTKDAKNDFANSTEDQVKSFEDLKAALCSPPILALPMRDRKYTMYTYSTRSLPRTRKGSSFFSNRKTRISSLGLPLATGLGP